MRVRGGKIAVVDRLHRAAGVFLDIGALANPGQAHGRQAAGRVLVKRRITPRSGGVIEAHGLVAGDATVEAMGGLEGDLPHGHAEVGTGARQIDAAHSSGGGVGGAIRAVGGAGGKIGAGHGRARRKAYGSRRRSFHAAPPLRRGRRSLRRHDPHQVRRVEEADVPQSQSGAPDSPLI